MSKIKVMKANLFGDLGSLGRGEYVLLSQNNFPYEYDDQKDKMIVADHDRCFSWDYEHTTRAFKKHTGTGDMGFEHFARSCTPKAAIDFAKDVLKADEQYPGVKWTGHRFLGTVNRSNGYAVWSLYLFAKGKDSDTEVYSGNSTCNPNIVVPMNHDEDIWGYSGLRRNKAGNYYGFGN